ncbi:MAG: hypothetical protein DWI02_07790 [Planctomycetota bacterium]|nr:MAG: hypothetical protein DWI02_07790 [Planctomycetota bacterium]
MKQFDRVSVLCLMVSGLEERHLIDHPLGGLPSKLRIESGFLFRFPGKRGPDPFNTSRRVSIEMTIANEGYHVSCLRDREHQKCCQHCCKRWLATRTSWIRFPDHASKDPMG